MQWRKAGGYQLSFAGRQNCEKFYQGEDETGGF